MHYEFMTHTRLLPAKYDTDTITDSLTKYQPTKKNNREKQEILYGVSGNQILCLNCKRDETNKWQIFLKQKKG